MNVGEYTHFTLIDILRETVAQSNYFIEIIIEPRSPIKKLLRCLNHYVKTFLSLYSAQN